MFCNEPTLKYCQCKTGTGHCSNIATFKVKLGPKKLTDKPKFINAYRCTKHIDKGTVSKKVVEKAECNQVNDLEQINTYLRSLIGKKIRSRFHHNQVIEVKYLKDNGAVMGFQPVTKKWKYIYYNQITEVIN
jgi:hypothetical protein